MPINLKMHKITNNVPTVNPFPEGGTTGQALVKKSDALNDVEWSDIVGGYTKPESGIPKTDLDSTVQTSLGLADTALQSFTETDPVFSASAASGITSTDISNWNGKQAAITDTNKLSYSLISGTPTIPDAVTESTVSGWGFTKNAGTYSKPSTGIPKTDLASAVQTSLEKADTALQSYTETDPTVPAWAKAENKPTYTASEVGALASTVTHLSGDIATTEKGAANGVATLGSDGKVPSTQLPSYVDDVLEYNAKTNFPASGESGKIYIDKATNITYRWGGSDYVAIGSDLALGETSSTAYAGDKGKANADAISTHTSNGDIHVTTTNKTAWNAKYDKPSGGIPKTDLASAVQTSLGKADTALQSFTETDPTVPAWAKAETKPTYTAGEVGARPSTWTPTKSDVGLGNVGNFKAVSTVASQGLTDTEKSNARANIGAGTGSYSKPSGGIPKSDLASAVQTSLGKADSALQSFTESDPVFSASAAAGIKSTDITNWNGKTSNTGTVTSVAVKMNNTTKGTVTSSGTIDLGTVITAHQDISGKQDKITESNKLAYSLLSGTPTIPTVNNATLTIQKNGTTVKTFTANASSNVTANITVPTKVSELTNDSKFATTSYVDGQVTNFVEVSATPSVGKVWVTNNTTNYETIYTKSEVDSLLNNKTASSEVKTIKVLTKSEYDAISSPVSTTLYLIKEG